MVVVYFSRAGENYGVGNVKVGNTAKLAEAIAEETDAPLIEITRNEPYPEGYDEATSVAQDERRDNARPQITLNGDADALESAGTIFLGYPICSARTKVAVWDRPQTTSLTPPAQS